MSRTALVLGSLVAGLAAGLAVRAVGPSAVAAAGYLKPLGTLWLNALQMTLVPLVFCLMSVGVAKVARAAGAGKVVGRAIGIFILLLLAGSAAGAAVAEGLTLLWRPLHLGTASAASLHAAAQAAPNVVDQLMSLIPLNPVAAAAAAAMTPLIVFAAFFGAAASRLQDPDQGLLVGVLEAAGDALLIIVGWVLLAAPVGVFVLAMGATSSVGLGAAAGLVQYVVLLSAVLVVGLVCALAIGMTSGVGPLRFLKAVAPPVALAISTQSSMACLPTLVKAAQDDLELPPPLVGALIPLSVTVFRFGNVFAGVAAALIGAKLYGIEPGLPQIALAVVVSVLANIGVMGLPGVAVLFAAYGPAFAILGAPLEALTLLVAVFTLPDMLDTSCNVTADLAVTSWIARLSGHRTGGGSPAAPGHSSLR
jgi:Na+/H+-dicarboxylate symporter